jgi:hypothetical protein
MPLPAELWPPVDDELHRFRSAAEEVLERKKKELV